MNQNRLPDWFQTLQRTLVSRREAIHTKLARFLHETSQRLQAFRDREEIRQRREADQFSVFRFFEPSENDLSNLFAELLDPRGRHGQGERFLLAWMAILQLAPPSEGKPRIIREERTSAIANPLRRIDLLIDWGSYAVAIENKKWTGELPRQLEDYREHLERRYGERFTLVFLTPDGREPESLTAEIRQRMRTKNQLRTMSYRLELRDWLSRCREVCEAERVRWFLLDLSNYCERIFSRAPEARDERECGE